MSDSKRVDICLTTIQACLWVALVCAVIRGGAAFGQCDGTPCDCPPDTICYLSPDLGSAKGIGCADGFVGINDLLFVLEYWGLCDIHPDDQSVDPPPRPYCPWGDIDRSGEVDVFDLLFVLDHWGPFDVLEWRENRCF